MNVIKVGCLALLKILSTSLYVLFFNTAVHASDFSVWCTPSSTDMTGIQCGPGTFFILQRVNGAYDSVPLPFAVNVMQIYLANCVSETSCTKLVGPVYLKYLGRDVNTTFGDFGQSFYNMPWRNQLNANFTTRAEAGTSNVWNGKVYKGLCLSLMGGHTQVISTTHGWALWGDNSPQPAGTVKCDAPINRVAADSCSASTPSIDVAFGELERSAISTQPGAETDKTKPFTLSFSGSSKHNFSVKLNMTPVSWSLSQIATSNPALGVTVRADGVTLDNGSTFTMNVPAGGTATTNLVFSALRNPSVAGTSIATGDFTASATLIITEI